MGGGGSGNSWRGGKDKIMSGAIEPGQEDSRFTVIEMGDILTISMIGVDGNVIDFRVFRCMDEDTYNIVGQLCSWQHTIGYAKEVLRKWAATEIPQG